MKVLDIPALVRSLTDVFSPTNDNAGGTTPKLLALMVRDVLDVHRHTLLRWDKSQARAIDTDVAGADFAICASCGSIEREFFWCPTIRQLYVTLCDAYEPPAAADAGLWQGWRDMADAVNRARAAYPPPVATAVIRALNNTAYSGTFRTNLLDAVITCTQAVPVQPARVEG